MWNCLHLPLVVVVERSFLLALQYVPIRRGGSRGRACWNRGGEVRHTHALSSSSPLPNPKTADCRVDLPSGLKLLLLKARSVNNKSMHIQDLILDGVDLAGGTKTWVDEV